MDNTNIDNELDKKLKRYIGLTSKALDKVNKVKIADNKNINNKKMLELLDLAQRYFDDAKYFEKKGDLINAYGAVVYAHAFLDIGALLGIFDVGTDNEMFMVD